jgi:hypothetical protein
MLKEAEEVHRLTPEEFPILPWTEPWRWWGPPNNPETLTDIADCGFNLAGFVTPAELDAVGVAGLKAIVFEDARGTSIHVVGNMSNLTMAEVQQRVDAMVGRVSENEALFAYYLRDEPGADLYPVLGKFTDAFRRADPDHPAYINLFPNYASTEQMDVPTYQQYVDSYVTTVKPAFISYDHYAMASDNTVANCYWTNIETIRTAARKNNLPFWNIVCAIKRSEWATPSPATLRFQLYTTLAYGAKGISWYTYYNWPAGLGIDFTLAPIDEDGNKTQTWYMLRDVNMQMHRIGRIYMTLNNVNVFHYPTVPDVLALRQAGLCSRLAVATSALANLKIPLASRILCWSIKA